VSSEPPIIYFHTQLQLPHALSFVSSTSLFPPASEVVAVTKWPDADLARRRDEMENRERAADLFFNGFFLCVSRSLVCLAGNQTRDERSGCSELEKVAVFVSPPPPPHSSHAHSLFSLCHTLCAWTLMDDRPEQSCFWERGFRARAQRLCKTSGGRGFFFFLFSLSLMNRESDHMTQTARQARC